MNMIALYSMGGLSFLYLGLNQPSSNTISDEQNAGYFWVEFNPTYHCVAFFIAAGLFSFLASHTVSVLPRLIRLAKSSKGLSSTAKPHPVSATLGASGAIYSTYVMTALAFPDMEAFIIFLPWILLPIRPLIMGIVALDAVGILRGWSILNHWAHLAGAAFGAWYYYFGPDLWVKMKSLEAAVHSSLTKRPYNGQHGVEVRQALLVQTDSQKPSS